jgi:tetratricopeptide (TPR) repeat protein
MLTGLVPRRHGVRDNALFKLDQGVPLLTEKLQEAGYKTAAFLSSVVLDRITGLDRGFDLYNDTVRVGERVFFNYEERAASQVTDDALRNIWQLKPPFFLWVHYFDPHLPYVPPEPFSTHFKKKPYDGEIAFMDQEIGRLLEAVQRKTDKLIIVVAGDHGESLKDHGEAGHGVFLYEATQRVPLIIKGPGIPEGKVIERNVGLVDLVPTILEMLSLSLMQDIDGQSLLPLIQGKEPALPDYELETFYPNYAYGWAPLRGLVRGNLKYIEAPRPELYDLESDPAEKKDLSSLRKKDAEKLAKVLKKLIEGDALSHQSMDADLLEQRRILESLGYVSGSGAADHTPSLDPKDGIKWIGALEKASRELQIGDPKKGISLLNPLLEKNPENMQARLILALCHLASGDIEHSIILLRQAVSDSPESDLTHYNLANALMEKWHKKNEKEVYEEARKEFEHVLELNPRHADAYLNYASLLSANREEEKAYQLFLKARQAGVADPEMEIQLGFMEISRGSPSSAGEAFNRAITLNPRASQALEGLGRVAYAKEQFPLAADYYARALKISPSADLAKTLGSIRLYNLNDMEGARKAYLMALKLLPPEDPDRLAVQDILESLKKTEREIPPAKH